MSAPSTAELLDAMIDFRDFVTSGFATIERNAAVRFESLERRLESLERRFESLDGWLQDHERRLGSVEAR